MQIVDTSLIFKKSCVDLEANTYKSQKSEFYEAWLAIFGPFFSNLGLLKAMSPSNLVMNNSWRPPILPHEEKTRIRTIAWNKEFFGVSMCSISSYIWPNNLAVR